MGDIGFARGFIASLTEDVLNKVRETEFIYLIPRGTTHNGKPICSLEFYERDDEIGGINCLIPFTQGAGKPKDKNPGSSHPSALLNSAVLKTGGTMSYEKTGDRELSMIIDIPDRPQLKFKRAEYISLKEAKLSMSQEALELLTSLSNSVPMVRRVRTCDVLNIREIAKFSLTTEKLKWPILAMVYNSSSFRKLERYFLSTLRRDLPGSKVYIYTFSSSQHSFDLLNLYGDKLVQIEVGQKCEVLYDNSGEYNKLIQINLIKETRLTQSIQTQTTPTRKIKKTSKNEAKKQSPYIIPRNLTKKEISSGKERVITVGAGGSKEKPVDRNRVMINNHCSKKYKMEPTFDSFFSVNIPDDSL